MALLVVEFRVSERVRRLVLMASLTRLRLVKSRVDASSRERDV